MNILDSLLASAQSGTLNRAAESRGISSADLPKLLEQLVPALSSGIQRNASSAGGLESLGKALASGNHARYLDKASALDDDSAVADGNGILGHLLGSKDVSRRLAGNAAEATGVDVDAIKKLLPIVAAAAMGALSKQTQGGQQLGGGSGLQGVLASFLDSNHDGSILDDLFSLGKKFLR